MHGTEEGAARPLDLAHRPALALGALTVTPSTRRFAGPGGSATVRPQVMLVFLTLADAGGAVVSRDELVERAWSGRFVAEDSLNGAISEIRSALRGAGSDDVQIVTIPKTGYRLHHPDLVRVPSADDKKQTRRWLMGGGAAVVAAAAAAWVLRTRRPDSSVDAHIDRGLIALRQGLPAFEAQGVSDFRAATAGAPGNARAWGLLALSLRAAAEYGFPEQAESARREAEAAARRALSLDSSQSDARTALALLTPSFGRWLEADRELSAVLASDPTNPFAVAGHATLMMSTGQVRRSLERLNWLDARDPLSPNLQFRRVYTLWSAGKLAEADATADRAMQSWPRHPAVWFARLWTFAFTRRVPRAQAMLTDEATRPAMPVPAADLLDLSLAALAEPGSSLARKAIQANLAAAGRGPGQATMAIMVLSGLGAAADAYDVARGFLVQRGKVIVLQRHTPQQASLTDLHQRQTMPLWIPATDTLRRDTRFPELCRDIGLADYWRDAGVRPDFLLGTARDRATTTMKSVSSGNFS